MPTIFIPEKKQFHRKDYKHSKKKDNDNHKAVYNTTTWRSVRLEKLKRNPLCEDCQVNGIIRSGIEVHHITPISAGKTKLEKQHLGFDPGNLRTLCSECHDKYR